MNSNELISTKYNNFIATFLNDENIFFKHKSSFTHLFNAVILIIYCIKFNFILKLNQKFVFKKL